MHDLDRNEDRLRGTYDFPFEFHHIDHNHPRYVMSYHWHVEYEIIRILDGSLTVTLDEKSFTATAGDIILCIVESSTVEFLRIVSISVSSLMETLFSKIIQSAPDTCRRSFIRRF